MSVLVSIVVLGQGIVGVSAQAPTAGTKLDGYYNRRNEVTFSGTVASKVKAVSPGKSQGMSILVRSGKAIREVELGPAWYVARQAAAVNLGDKIKVTAVPLNVGRRRVFLARQIVRGRSILALRDAGGNPYWSIRRERVASNNASGAAMQMGNAYEGTVERATTFMVNGEQYAGYVVNTANGPVNVAMAPTWYWNNQPNQVGVGQNISLYGNGPATVVGNNGVGIRGGNGVGVILVNSATYGGGTIVLRPGGIPVYGGFRTLP